MNEVFSLQEHPWLGNEQPHEVSSSGGKLIIYYKLPMVPKASTGHQQNWAFISR